MNEINLDDILSENIQEEHQDLLQILGDEKELLNDSINIPDTLPILPLRNTVLFPGVIIPINIGREKSLKLIKYAYKQSAMIGVIAQKDTNTENPAQSVFYRYRRIRFENIRDAGWNNNGNHSGEKKIPVGGYPVR